MNEVKKITLDLTNLKEFENTLEGIDHLLVNIDKELEKANQPVSQLTLGKLTKSSDDDIHGELKTMLTRMIRDNDYSVNDRLVASRVLQIWDLLEDAQQFDGKLTSKKTFPIIVNGEAYERINVVGKDNNELIASISSTEIIGEKGYRVDLVKSTK